MTVQLVGSSGVAASGEPVGCGQVRVMGHHFPTPCLRRCFACFECPPCVTLPHSWDLLLREWQGSAVGAQCVRPYRSEGALRTLWSGRGAPIPLRGSMPPVAPPPASLPCSYPPRFAARQAGKYSAFTPSCPVLHKQSLRSLPTSLAAGPAAASSSRWPSPAANASS